MSLRIRQFATTCYVPRSSKDKAALVDELARGRFATDLAAHLGPSLSRQPGIVRIHGLSLRVIVPEPDLTADALSQAWAQALLKALFTALQYPSGTGPVEVFRAESTTVYLAGAIRDLLEGVARTRWYYAEFEELFGLGNTQAAVALLCRWKDETLPILFDLASTGDLDRFFASVHDAALERVFVALSETNAPGGSPTLDDILKAVRLAVSNPPEIAAVFKTRRYALRQFVNALRNGNWAHSASTLFNAFRLIWRILTEGIATLTAAQSSGESLAITPVESPELRRWIEIIATEFRDPPHAPQRAELVRTIEQLRIRLDLPSPPGTPSSIRWTASQWVGLFFLTSTLENTRWIPAWQRLADFERGGVSCLIAGIALSLAGRFEVDLQSLEPALAVFAGYDEDPDLNHLRTVFAESAPAVRQRVLEAALNAPDPDAADSWEATFHMLAGELIQRFASSLRGFRRASRAGIVRTFLERPGRIGLSENRIYAVPDPSPYHVVLHIAGLDEPVHRVSWMGDRRLEFEVGDL